MDNLVDNLVLSSLKHNYVEFVKRWGFDEANSKLHNLFGEVWLNNREQIWQWYDQGQVHTTYIYDMTEGK